ncbi:chorismate mutase [Myxococcota bacterium]|nr:chorismate mutase [Myxococcota bacterium]
MTPAPTALAVAALRREIDRVDAALVDLLLERQALSAQVQALKRSAGLPPTHAEREAQILDLARSRAPTPDQARALERVFRAILDGAHVGGAG